MKSCLFCGMFREVMYGVIKASLEMPERTNFMLAMTRKLTLPDEAEVNSMSTRFHWRGPLHEYLWRDLQHREIPGTPHFQLYPQPPGRESILHGSKEQRCPIFNPRPLLHYFSLHFHGEHGFSQSGLRVLHYNTAHPPSSG